MTSRMAMTGRQQNQQWVDALKPAEPSGASSLERERKGSPVDSHVLGEHLMGREYLERQDRVLALMMQEKVFSKEQVLNLSRPERYKLGLARGKRMRQLQQEHGWDDDDHEMAKYLCDETSPYQLHNTMFRRTLVEQATNAQREYWLPKTQSWDIVGCYAQTEMGHGSNVSGLETTATWHQATRQFILDSPTLTASKWWPGSLGRTANHAIIVAQLLLPCPLPSPSPSSPSSPSSSSSSSSSSCFKSHGPHPFIVQIRDMKTHEPVQGVVAGDIGPKFGYASMDNGYLLLNKVRVPHSALLARYSGVDPDTGAYLAPENKAVVYGSLTHARKRIIMAARLVLARATTISVRYCAVRRQFSPSPSPSPSPSATEGIQASSSSSSSSLSAAEETPVLDYQTVQIRLFPLVAASFALHYGAKMMGEVYDQTRADMETREDTSTLADMHSLSSGLKSLATELAANGIETCRRAMGGHGYSGASGLVSISADYASKPTVEGDNWMITQQMARYLIKKAKLITTTDISPKNQTENNLLRYWQGRIRQPTFHILSRDEDIVSAFWHRAAFLTFKAYDLVEVQKLPKDRLLIQLHQLSNAQSEAILVQSFFEGLEADSKLDEPTRQVLGHLFRLFSLDTISKHGHEFVRSGAVSAAQLDAIVEQTVPELLRLIRPHAVAVVDSWKFPDYLLNSALGRYDGCVYEDMFHRAHRLNPLNDVTFNPDYKSDEIVHGSGDRGILVAKL